MGILLEPQGNQRNALETLHGGPRPTTHTPTLMDSFRHDSQTTEAESRAQLSKHRQTTVRTQRHESTCTAPRPAEQTPKKRIPPKQAAHERTNPSPADTHTAKPRETGRPRQPTTCAHTLPGHQKHIQPSEGATCTHTPPRAHTITILRPTDRRTPAHHRCPPQGPRPWHQDHFPHVPAGLG